MTKQKLKNLSRFSFEALSSVFTFLDCSFSYQCLSQQITISNAVKEAILFSLNFREELRGHYQQSISILSERFDKIPFKFL